MERETYNPTAGGVADLPPGVAVAVRGASVSSRLALRLGSGESCQGGDSKSEELHCVGRFYRDSKDLNRWVASVELLDVLCWSVRGEKGIVDEPEEDRRSF